MADQPSEPILASWSFDRRFMRKGRKSALVLVPESYLASIGLIIAHWGQFEGLFDKCLEALLAAEACDGVARAAGSREFKRRRNLFKAICAEWLTTWNSQVATELCRIADTAGDLAWKRNMIAHGAYAYTILPNSSEATNCRAVNHDTDEVFPFDEMILKKLYHDIAHLTAELLREFRKIGQVEGGPPFILPDNEVLRVYRETSHPWNPNLAKRLPSPER